VPIRPKTERRDTVVAQLDVLSAENHALEIGLRDEYPVERIGVMARQPRRELCVLVGDRQQLKAVGDDRRNETMRKAELADRALDADFPDRCGAGEYFIAGIGNCLL
jgi:hypothetical protein